MDWYDYGARMYDPALGRWHIVNPLLQFASPYVYCGNNPINFVDYLGMGPDDPKTSIYIYMATGNYEELKANTQADQGDWHIVFAASFEEANTSVSEYLGDTKADNIVLISHGKGEESSGGQINSLDGNIITTNLTDVNNAQGDFSALQATTGSDKKVSNVQNFVQLGTNVKDGGNFVVGACGAGNDSQMGGAIQMAVKNEGGSTVNVLTNKDNSQMAVYSYGGKPIVTLNNWSLTSNTSVTNKGWTQTNGSSTSVLSLKTNTTDNTKLPLLIK